MTIFDISVEEDDTEKRKADQAGHRQKKPCSRLQELTRQIVVSLFDSVHDWGLGGWIASTTREEYVETVNPCRMGETVQLKTARVGK